MAKPATGPIWTRAYTFLYSTVFLSNAQYSMLFVAIPRYVDHLGHSAFIAQIAAIALIITWGTLPASLLGGVLNAAGNAVNGASTMALAMDLADPRRRGTAMATFSLSFQMGLGIGAVLAGALATLAGLRGMCVGSIVILTCGLLLALANWRRIGHVIPLHELA